MSPVDVVFGVAIVELLRFIRDFIKGAKKQKVDISAVPFDVFYEAFVDAFGVKRSRSHMWRDLRNKGYGYHRWSSFGRRHKFVNVKRMLEDLKEEIEMKMKGELNDIY